jgi:hypothetical protein
VECLLKATIVQPAETAVAGERLCKLVIARERLCKYAVARQWLSSHHVMAATDTHAIVEEPVGSGNFCAGRAEVI